MIIRYPTGLYVTELPQKPEDSGSVTYTISNEDPPVTIGDFVIYPIAEKKKTRSPKSYTPTQRRLKLGELVYTVISGGVPASGRSTEMFEVGQSLDFDTQPIDLNYNTIPSKTELQHNTNMLDLHELGVSDIDSYKIENEAMLYKEELEKQITAIQNSIADNQAQIVDLQKTINEANKAIDALVALGTSEDIKAKIVATRESATNSQSQLISTTNTLITELSALQAKLFNVSQLVR